MAAPDGLEAWHLVQEAPPDLVISDGTMPRLDGGEVCRRVRALAGQRGSIVQDSEEHHDQRTTASH